MPMIRVIQLLQKEESEIQPVLDQAEPYQAFLATIKDLNGLGLLDTTFALSFTLIRK